MKPLRQFHNGLMTTAASALLILTGCSKQPEALQTAETTRTIPETIRFNQHIRPILTENCTGCHGGVKSAGGVSYVYQEKALGYSLSGKRIIDPGNPDGSELVRRIRSEDPEIRMPPEGHGDPLDLHEIALLEQWIRDGAEWEEHWSYLKPQAQPVPEVANQDWPRVAIDRFILAELEKRDLSPNEEEDKPRLLRRVSLDLIGLPPSQEELTAFLENKDSDAYEKAVDRLLKSPHFGERWAAMWLDIARYADSMGFESDNYRNIWPYRDWVIRAFNQDLPFDEFTREQIAGDLLPGADFEALVATAFHRNTKNNMEGGTDDEEYRTVAVIDRVNTTWKAWMGTTFSCVQCHAHPYDPFPHESYYEFFDFFNHDVDHDTPDDFPTVLTTLNEADSPELSTLQQTIAQTEEAFLKPFHAKNAGERWQPLSYRKASSTRNVILSILRDEEGVEYLQTGPNAPREVIHTVLAETDLSRLAALKVDALMLPGASVAEPGDPFVVSHFEAFIINSNETETPITFSRVAADEAQQRLWPELSLDPKSKNGWAAYPKQHYSRWAIFIPEQAVEIPGDAVLKIVVHNMQRHDGAQQPVLRKFRISISDDSEWNQLATHSDTLARLETRQQALDRIKELDTATVPVMRLRRDDLHRETRIFDRGNWQNKKEVVTANTPSLLHPVHNTHGGNRLDLAEWLVDPDNPLTARVTVNRFWEQLFGLGIVETLEDFGSPGIPPTHPELLDYLALRFQKELGWSIKALLREIVLSATYRQSAVATIEKREKDPRNRWLSRGPRSRLTAEMVRDNALAVSGLLSLKQFGEPVMPPQPEGIWRVVYNNMKWETSEGEDRYRRAVYTHWKRSSPYPSFLTFDAPSRDNCSVRRIPTNTPLQALVTMNDPVYVEAAQALARVAFEETEGDAPAAIHYAYERALCEEPDASAQEKLYQLFRDAEEAYLADSELAGQLAKDASLAAMALVANTIMNLDAFITK